MNYYIIESIDKDEFIATVEKYLDWGYELYGTPFSLSVFNHDEECNYDIYAQAVIRK
jgi:hypothetical protein